MVAGLAELPSDGFQDTQLLKRRGPVVQPDFLGDFAVLEAHDGGSRKVHLPARRRRERADEEISESGSGVREPPVMLRVWGRVDRHLVRLGSNGARCATSPPSLSKVDVSS